VLLQSLWSFFGFKVDRLVTRFSLPSIECWAKLLKSLRKSPQSEPVPTTKSHENPQHFSGTIVAQTTVRSRAATLKKFMPLLTRCLKLENISDAFEVVGGTLKRSAENGNSAVTGQTHRA
jgi:hypothetical protein